jgi:hypothetical protein
MPGHPGAVPAVLRQSRSWSADPGVGGNAGGISWIELAGDAARLERWLDSTPLPIRVVEGPAAVRAVGIGDRTLRSLG